MAYKESNGLGEDLNNETSNITKLQASGETLSVPDESYIRDAEITRDGMDLVLDGPKGEIVVEGYFSAADAPDLVAPNGATLTPQLVNSFSKSQPFYAENSTMNDASPVGAVQEISGEATITRTDGSSEPLSLGSRVFQGDIIETNKGAAVNVEFIDDSSFAVSEDSRLSIDEYVFDASSEAGAQNFSVLKGVFVFTSGLIGRDDPDDVSIDTPVGSIGIRGTIIAGDVNSGEITVVEGAIVLRNAAGQELTLDDQFETGRFLQDGSGITNLGQLEAEQVSDRFSIVSKVSPSLFSSINDAAAENNAPEAENAPAEQQTQDADAPVEGEAQEFDADGATDQDGDSEVDGTVDEQGAAEETPKAEGLEVQESKIDIKDSNQAENTIQNIQQTTINASADAAETAARTLSPRQKLLRESRLVQELIEGEDENFFSGGISENNGGANGDGNGFTVGFDNSGVNLSELTGNTTLTSNTFLGVLRGAGNSITDVQASSNGANAADTSLIWEETSEGSGEYNVFLRAGQQLNFEKINNQLFKFDIEAVDANGDTQIRDITIDLGIADINEGPIVDSIAGSGASLGLIEADGTVEINLSQFFSDPDMGANGDLTFTTPTLSFSGTVSGNGSVDPNALLNSQSFDADTGILTLSFKDNTMINNVAGDLTISLEASDGTNSTGLQTFDFTVASDAQNNILNIGSNLTSGTTGDIFATDVVTDLNTRIRSSGVSVFTSDNDDAIRIDNSGDNVTLNSGGGDDEVRVTDSTNSTIVTGSGNDQINLGGNNEGTSVLAMKGSDRINLDGNQINNLSNGSLNDIHLDGGNGLGAENFDTLGLSLADGNNIDFTAILDQGHTIKNIEVIDLRSGGNANVVTLNYTDVVNLTDDRNILHLELDDEDSVNFDSEGEGVTDLGTQGNFQAYQFNDVTLLVENNATINVDGVAV